MNELSYTASPKVGFPHYVTTGHLWWKKKVPYGWDDRGEIAGKPYELPKDQWWERRNPLTGEIFIFKMDEKVPIHKICRTRVHIGRENNDSFKFCLKCLVKIK